MSPLRLFWQRTLSRAAGEFSTAFVIAVFVAATAVLTVFGIDRSEGTLQTLVSVWALAVARALPALAAFLAMNVWSEERRSGRYELLLTTPVSEASIVWGKYLGVLTLMLLSVMLSMAAIVFVLPFFSSSALSGIDPLHLCFAVFSLLLQGTLWCAVTVALSSLLSHAAAVAAAAILLMVVLPQAVWLAMLSWMKDVSSNWGEMPLEANAVDFAAGSFSMTSALSYPIFACAAIFLAIRSVISLRYVGKASRSLRWSSRIAVVMVFVAAALLLALVARFDITVEVPSFGSRTEFSDRTRRLLAESEGEVTVTCYLSRHDNRFRSTAHFLRSLKRESAAVGGTRLTVRYVDPRWDLVNAERLVRAGIAEDCIVFESGRQMIAVPIAEGVSERQCVSTLYRLSSPARRRVICWTVGHGEDECTDYGDFGLSEIARELVRDGFRNEKLDLQKMRKVPGECAMIVIAGARDDFSRSEAELLENYLHQGGRLLVLLGSADRSGVASTLLSLGVRIGDRKASDLATTAGDDVIVSEFPPHVITRRMRRSRLLLSNPVPLFPSAAVESGSDADRLGFSVLAKNGNDAFAVAVEQGAGAGSDLAVRPMRIVVVGDAGCVRNRGISGAANKSFFLNAVSYLSGMDATEDGEHEAGTLAVQFDRRSRNGFMVFSAVAVPLTVFVVFALFAWRRKGRR